MNWLCHDNFTACSPMIVSTLSIFLSGSKSTRLLKQGIAGQTVEIVAVSWMAKPCARSSRSIMLSTPPDFGVWLVAGAGGAATPRAGTRRKPGTGPREMLPVPANDVAGLPSGPQNSPTHQAHPPPEQRQPAPQD